MIYDKEGKIIEFETGIRRTKEKTREQLYSVGAISVKTVKTNNDLVLKYIATFPEGELECIVLLKKEVSTNGCLNNSKDLDETYQKISESGRNPLVFISDVKHDEEPVHEFFKNVSWSLINPPNIKTPAALTEEKFFRNKSYLKEDIIKYFNTKEESGIIKYI